MEELMIPQPPLPQREEDRQAPTATDDRQGPVMEELMIPQSPPHVQGPPINDPEGGAGLQHDELPEDLHPLHDGAGSPPPPAVGNTRPHRNTRPPERYTDAGYDVSTLMLTDQNFSTLL